MSKALVYAVFGARGTGKTAFVKQLIARQRPDRLIVWDFKHDPTLRDLGTAYTDLSAFIRAMKAPRFCIRYLPTHGAGLESEFDRFCEAAWIASRLWMFVDELPEVTKPNKAPPAWRRCINVGRQYHAPRGDGDGWLSIIGAGQRPAECDKSVFSNADVIHTGRLTFRTDCREMAKLLDVPEQEVQQLPDLHWIERQAGKREPVRGVLTFGNAKQKKPADQAARAVPLKRSP